MATVAGNNGAQPPPPGGGNGGKRGPPDLDDGAAVASGLPAAPVHGDYLGKLAARKETRKFL